MVQNPHDQDAVPGGRGQRLVFGFGALLILAALFAGIVINANHAAAERREAQAWHVHTLEVLLTTATMKSAVNMSIRGERGYLITGDPKFLQPYRAGAREAPVALERIAAQTRDNPAQRRNIAALRAQAAIFYKVMERAIALRRAGDEAGAVALVRSGAGIGATDAVLAALGTIEAEEQRLLAVRSAANERANDATQTSYYALVVAGLVLLLVAAAVGVSTAKAQKRVRIIAEQLRLSATTDELTGLPNRRFFMHSLDIEVARARRSGAPLSVAVADVDHFKRVNDRYGHGGGDEVLRALARIFEAIMRTGDVVGRLGGEEFAILMPDTDEIQARIACERLRGAIAGREIRLPSGEKIAITLSTGIALLVPGDDRDKLVKRADNALYSAKEGGRNQVRLAA
ncbi:diguanylate cyclase [Sphingomonas sp. LB-2]|uniref:diguanylate cyclase n=1 Tax=Sphingomonas caeni TaxID=2984949 RepID=UPI00222FE4C6|nr:diguanylate cyclase [Sphingomonas caeni]MCW3846304.1 diguanylate cyclase [Sphingomonas caeni]